MSDDDSSPTGNEGSDADAGRVATDAGKHAERDDGGGAHGDASANPVARDGAVQPRLPDAATGQGSSPEASALCHLKGSEVAVLGDSYVALDPSYVELDTQPFTRNLEDLARAYGALGTADQYRRSAMSGASLDGFPSIPAQLDATLKTDPDLKLLIMDGGGNDVLVNNRQCLEFATAADLEKNQSCVQTVKNASDYARQMFATAEHAGVQAIVFFFYPHLPGNAPGVINLAGTYPNVVLDYAYPIMKAACDEQTIVPCYFVDTRSAFDRDGDGVSDPGLISMVDGIHPTAEGSKILAAAVWHVMQQECLASAP